MDDFLHRLYRLTRSQRRLPREDFVSLCFGQHLERDATLATSLVEAIAKQTSGRRATSLQAWAAADPSRRVVEVRAQVSARTPDATHAGLADLVVDLEDPGPTRVVLEAKVDRAAPEPSQLQRYSQAFPDALVVSLVEERARSRCPDNWPIITWDQVLQWVPASSGSSLLDQSRRDLRRLVAEAEVGDARLALLPAAWTSANIADQRFDRLETKLEEALVALGPNAEVRTAIQDALQDEDTRAECSLAWGVGVWMNKALPGTRLSGICLGVDAGEHRNEVVWRLEVRPKSRKLRSYLDSEHARTWLRVPGERGWFVTDLYTSRGARTLNKADFTAVVQNGRLALRELHHHVNQGAWQTHGSGTTPYAPKHQSIPMLREGIRDWRPVNRALWRTAAEVIERLVPNANKTPCIWHGDAWRSRPGVIPGGVRVRVGVGDKLAHLFVEVENATEAVHEAMELAVSRWHGTFSDRLALRPEPGRVTLRLGEDTWQSQKVIECLVDVARAGMGSATG